MKLYIMRHGDAVAAMSGQPDAQRMLSNVGQQEVLTNARWLAEQTGGEALDLVITSPYTRAQATSTVVSSLVSNERSQTTADITPDGEPDLVVSYLQALVQQYGIDSESGRVLLVSHMPFVSYLVAELDARVQPPIFPTGSIAEIDFDVVSGKGQLAGFIIADKCV